MNPDVTNIADKVGVSKLRQTANRITDCAKAWYKKNDGTSYFEYKYPELEEFLQEKQNGAFIEYCNVLTQMQIIDAEIIRSNPTLKFWHSTSHHKMIFLILSDHFFEQCKMGSPYKSLPFHQILERGQSSRRTVVDILNAACDENFALVSRSIKKLRSHPKGSKQDDSRNKREWTNGAREHLYAFSSLSVKALMSKYSRTHEMAHKMNMPDAWLALKEKKTSKEGIINTKKYFSVIDLENKK